MNKMVGSVILKRDEIAQIRANLTPVHREVTKNSNYRDVQSRIASTGQIPGGITLCTVAQIGRTAVDGNHRLEAALETERDTFQVDVTDYGVVTLQEFSTLYLESNKAIKTQTVGDKLRARAQNEPKMQALMSRFPWLSYLNDKNKSRVPVQTVLTSARAALVANPSARQVLDHEDLLEDLDWLHGFLELCERAWPLNIPANKIYYNVLNLTITAWAYLRIVEGIDSCVDPSKRVTKVSRSEFEECMAYVAGDTVYGNWLPRRTLAEQNRRDGYNRMKAIFSEKLSILRGSGVALPCPEWSRKAQRLGKFVSREV